MTPLLSPGVLALLVLVPWTALGPAALTAAKTPAERQAPKQASQALSQAATQAQSRVQSQTQSQTQSQAQSQLQSRAQTGAPDVIFFHGDILTGAHLRAGDLSSTPARATAIAVLAGRLVAVGTDADLLRLRGPHTSMVDLGGHFALPGFNDAHTHIASAGRQRLAVNLVGASSLDEMKRRIQRYAPTLPIGNPSQTWLLGGGWDHTLWPTRTLPNRLDLDTITAGHPALLDRVDGHIAVANSAALAAAGLTDTTPDPAGGKLDHDASGRLTGIVREAPALALVQAHIPKPGRELRRRALQLSIDDALAHGVTSVQDFSDWEDWLVLKGMEAEGRLPLRIYEWVAFDQPLAALEQERASYRADDPLLHLGMLKAFMDGSLGSRTAALNAPYSDDRTNSGLARYDQNRLNALSVERGRAGFQLGFHAIGDRANDMALDAFEAAEKAGKAGQPSACTSIVRGVSESRPCPIAPRDFRFRIEHAQVLSPGAMHRFAELGVIASMQPSHLLTDMAWAGARLGPDRSHRAYAWHSLLAHGVTLAFGTDYPVESISPFRGLYAALTRRNEAGTATFQPEHAADEILTINEALYAYTQASAFAEFREHLKGRLEPGFLADFVVLDRDLTRVPPADILHTTVLRTVVGGETRYVAPRAAALAQAPPGRQP